MIALIGLRWHIGGGTSGYNFMCDSYCLDRWQKHLGKAETNYICPATIESWTIRLMYFLVIMCSQAAECWRKYQFKTKHMTPLFFLNSKEMWKVSNKEEQTPIRLISSICQRIRSVSEYWSHTKYLRTENMYPCFPRVEKMRNKKIFSQKILPGQVSRKAEMCGDQRSSAPLWNPCVV